MARERNMEGMSIRDGSLMRDEMQGRGDFFDALGRNQSRRIRH